jgi:hypothetical protein
MTRSLLLLALPLLLHCDHGSSGSAPDAAPAVSATNATTATAKRIHWMQGPSGLTDVTSAVKDAYAKEHAEGRTLLVYVGATWCEPCQRFHHAVEAGDLDATFPNLSILAFDSDTDGEALGNGGYFSRLIPLLALPGPDGHASGKQIEGGIKGDGAVGYIAPRLQALLAGGT